MESEKLEQVWRAVCDQVKSYNNIDPSQINAFFSRLQPQAMSEDFLMLTADNDFIKTWTVSYTHLDVYKRQSLGVSRETFQSHRTKRAPRKGALFSNLKCFT